MPSNKKTQLFIDAVERLRRSGEVRFDSEIIEKKDIFDEKFCIEVEILIFVPSPNVLGVV